jgi:hypothetical protein
MSLAEHCSPLTAPNTWKKTESTLRQIWGQQDKDKGQDSEVGGQWPMQCKWGAAQSVLCHQTKHFTNPLTNGCLLKHVLTALVDSGMSVPGVRVLALLHEPLNKQGMVAGRKKCHLQLNNCIHTFETSPFLRAFASSVCTRALLQNGTPCSQILRI